MQWMKVLAVAVVVLVATTCTVHSTDVVWPRRNEQVQFNTSYPFQIYVSDPGAEVLDFIWCDAANGDYEGFDDIISAPSWTIFTIDPSILSTGSITSAGGTLVEIELNINDPTAHPNITPYQSFPIVQMAEGLVSFCCQSVYVSGGYSSNDICTKFYWTDNDPDISSQPLYFHRHATSQGLLYRQRANMFDFTVPERARADKMNVSVTCVGEETTIQRTMYLNLPSTNSSYPHRFQFDFRRLDDDDVYPLVDYVPKNGTLPPVCLMSTSYTFQDAAANNILSYSASPYLKLSTNTPTGFSAAYLSGNVVIAMTIDATLFVPVTLSNQCIGVNRNSTMLEFTNGEVRTVIRLNPSLFAWPNSLTITVPAANVLLATSNLSPTPVAIELLEGAYTLAPGIYNVSLHLQDWLDNPPVTVSQVNVNISSTASLDPVVLWPQSNSTVTDLITVRYRVACPLLAADDFDRVVVFARVGSNSTVRIYMPTVTAYRQIAGTYSVSINATDPRLHYNTSRVYGELEDGVYDIFMTWKCADESFRRFSNIVRNVRIDGHSEPPDLGVPPQRVLMRHIPYHIQLHPDPVPNSVKVTLTQTNCTAQWNVSFDPLTLVAQGTLDVTNLTGTSANCAFDPAFAVEMTASYAQMLRPTKILHGVARNAVLVDGQVTENVATVITEITCSAGERWNGSVIAVLFGCVTVAAIVGALAMSAYMRNRPFNRMGQAYDKLQHKGLRR